MDDEKLITVPVAEGSWAMGRNGSRDIGEVTLRLVAPSDKSARASLQFVTRKRKILMNGGAVIDAAAIDKLAEQWLALRRRNAA